MPRWRGWGRVRGIRRSKCWLRCASGWGSRPGVTLFGLMDLAEEMIVPMMDQLVRIDRASLTIGYAGVYSTFLHEAKRAAKAHGVPARDILLELGRLKMIGGQEDMIEDTALTMARERAAERGALTSAAE